MLRSLRLKMSDHEFTSFQRLDVELKTMCHVICERTYRASLP